MTAPSLAAFVFARWLLTATAIAAGLAVAIVVLVVELGRRKKDPRGFVVVRRDDPSRE